MGYSFHERLNAWVQGTVRHGNEWGGKGWMLRVAGLVLASPTLVVSFFLEPAPSSQSHTFTPVMARTAFVTILMALYWITEALPLSATALLPLVLFPLLGVLQAAQVSSVYLNDTLFLLLGSFLVALAMEEWALHRRIALRFILLVGHNPRGILAGFMFLTAFLSMWLNNTATTSLMIPIALAILSQIQENDPTQVHTETTHLNQQDVKTYTWENSPNKEKAVQSSPNSPTGSTTTTGITGISGEFSRTSPTPHIYNDADDEEEGAAALPIKTDEGLGGRTVAYSQERQYYMDKFVKGLLMGIAYASSIGGTATLTGTAPNLVLVTQVSLIPNMPAVTFFKWMVFAFPVALVFQILLWAVFNFIFCPPADKAYLIHVDKKLLFAEYAKLGPTTWPQKVVLVVFVMMAGLWLTRTGVDDLDIPGWIDLFEYKYLTDGTVAMFCGLILFFIPSRVDPNRNVMDWQCAAKLPWDVIILIGGGFALAKALTDSGLSMYLGRHLHILDSVPLFLIILLICAFSCGITELTSNVATTNMLLPILAVIAISINKSPLLLMIPATISCSYAFMLPVATPPNAIIFASKHLKVTDMAKTGLLANVIGLILLPVASYLFLPLVWDIDD